MACRTLPAQEPSDNALITVLRTLVDKVGLRAILLTLAGICHEKAIEHVADEARLAEDN